MKLKCVLLQRHSPSKGAATTWFKLGRQCLCLLKHIICLEDANLKDNRTAFCNLNSSNILLKDKVGIVSEIALLAFVSRYKKLTNKDYLFLNRTSVLIYQQFKSKANYSLKSSWISFCLILRKNVIENVSKRKAI